MKKLRSQHDELQEEMSNLSKVHKKSQAENIGYKAKLNSLIHASELLEQADLAKELLKAEIAEANNTIKQMKINQKSTQKVRIIHYSYYLFIQYYNNIAVLNLKC